MIVKVKSNESEMPVVCGKIPESAKNTMPIAKEIKINVLESPKNSDIIAGMSMNIIYINPKNYDELKVNPAEGINEGIVQTVNSDRYMNFAGHSDYTPVIGFIENVIVAEEYADRGICRMLIHELPVILNNALNVTLTSAVINRGIFENEDIDERRMEHFLLLEGFRPVGDEYMSVIYSIR